MDILVPKISIIIKINYMIWGFIAGLYHRLMTRWLSGNPIRNQNIRFNHYVIPVVNKNTFIQ